MKVIVSRKKMVGGAFFAILLFSLWVLFAFNSVNNDRDNYLYLYESKYMDPNIEKGYLLLTSIFSSYISFEGFQMILATAVLLFIGRFLWKNSHAPFFMLFLYTLFPFVLDTIQYRNTIVECLLWLGLLELYKYKDINRKKGVLIYVFIILLASTFHKIALFYIIYILMYLPRQMIKRVLIWLLPLEFVTIQFFPDIVQRILAFSSKATRVYGNKGLMTEQNTRLLFLVFLCAIPIMFYIISAESHNSKNEKVYLLDFCKIISYLSMIWYPLLILSVDFFRIYRNLIVFIEIGLVNYICTLDKRFENFLWKIVIVIFNFLLAMAFIFMYSNNWENLMNNSFLNNLF